MNRGRFTTIASGFAIPALGLVLAGCAGPAPAPAAVLTRAGSAAAAPQYVVTNCMDKAQVKPGTISLACADNGLGLTHLHWTSWTPELASAYGTEWEHVCVPYCAASNRYAYYPVVAVLRGSATVKGHPGERRYTQVTIIYMKGRPAVYVRSCNGKVVATYPVSWTLPLV